MKKVFKILIENILVLGVVRLLLKLNAQISLLVSHVKLKALVKNSEPKSYCHWTVEIKFGHNIRIGYHSSVGPYSCLGAKSPISIGSNVRISRGVIIETASLDLNQPAPYPHVSKEIIIEDGVWIASNAIILGGVTIGKNAIVGAGAVVSKNVLPDTVVVGQPLRSFSRK